MLVFIFRHQRLYSLLDRFRLMVAPDTTSPSPLVTLHPLDGEDQPGLENVILDKVRFCLEMPCSKSILLIVTYLIPAYFYYALKIINLK